FCIDCDRSTRMKREVLVFGLVEDGANHDVKVEIAFWSEISNRTRVNASTSGFIKITKLHSGYLWCPRHRSGRKCIFKNLCVRQFGVLFTGNRGNQLMNVFETI